LGALMLSQSPAGAQTCSFTFFFIFVGCILLRYLLILYEHIIYTIDICNPQSQLFLFVRYLTTRFGPYGPSSGDI
jgi:hypothetical protein